MSSSFTCSQAPAPECSVKDCTLPVDVILKSSDGKFLGAHACNLATYGEAFPCVDGTVVASEPVALTENKATLKTLLAFMHLAPQPKIRNLPCTEVLALAEAAEKYGVHSTTQVCAIVLESKVASQPITILRFALKHGYRELANASAPHTLAHSTDEMMDHYKENDYALMKWLLYCARWEELTRNASKKNSWRIHRGGSAHCEYWGGFWAAVLGDLLLWGKGAIYGGKLRTLVEPRLDVLHGCEYCTPDVKYWITFWEKEAEDLAAKGIM